jgi:inhibitor of cysteine peptidase
MVRKFSDIKAQSPYGRRPGEKLVSSHAVSSLEEVRLEKVDGRLRGYKKSHVYLTEPGTYTIKARVALSNGHSAISQPVTIKIIAAKDGDAEDKATDTKPDSRAATKPKPHSKLKYVFVGKLKSSEQYFAGRGAAAGRFPSYKLRFEVVEVREGDLKVGQVVPCDQSATPRYKTPLKAADVKVGEKYFVGSPYKHPAHVEGLYLLEYRLAKFPVRKEGGASTPPNKEAAGAKPTGGRAINLNITANGKTVPAGVGDVVIVELDANPATGFAWAPDPATKSPVLVLQSKAFETLSQRNPEVQPVIGQDGVTTFTYQVAGTGKAAVSLVYRRPGEEDAKPAKAFRVEIEATKMISPVVTGKIVFSEEPDVEKISRIVVSIRNTALADGPSPLIGTVELKPPFKLPVTFAVPYDPATVRPAPMFYSISVRVNTVVDGSEKLYYINDTAHHVFREANDTKCDVAVKKLR